MAVELLLWCMLVLLGTALAAVIGARRAADPFSSTRSRSASPPLPLGTAALGSHADTGLPQTLRLPIGLPWLGAHFRLDPLAAAFLVVVNLGAATASLYGLGYGRHERGARSRAAFLSRFSRRNESRRACRRRVHVPVELGVHVAHLVGARHGAPPAARQRARGLHLLADGQFRDTVAAARLWSPGRSRRRLCVRCDPQHPPFSHRRCGGSRAGLARRRLQGRARAVARLVAARPSGGAEPRVRAHERRHDQGRGVRFRSRRVRPDGAARVVVGAQWFSSSAASPPFSACCMR